MYIPITKKFYDYEMNKRKQLDIFDYWQLAQPMRFYTEESTENFFYGHERIIKNYFNIPTDKNLKATIEHGLYVENELWWDGEVKGIDTIYTFGKKRKKFLQKSFPHKNIYNIGSYIKFASDIYQQERLEFLKKRYGKILLVFPAHSISYAFAGNNIKSMVNEIENIKRIHHFDSVFVCLYWKDILLEKFNLYKKNKYTIVTAGHSCDYYFLNRLRSIISLADVIMTNELGTHAVYSTHMDKPLYFFEKNVVKVQYDKQWTDLFCNYDMENKWNEMRNDWHEQFGEYGESLTKQQREFIAEYDAEDEVKLSD